ncbi:uncharacterized protein LOC130998134 [Salvia miltiorrhiza]|uniref:uncharacterized protein LOC130998134 n=1 Tax=Salvia miltiorrhiza TaxID=226208 RepID=UPI0025AB80F5|nr:uncharacterized protein LOC130998134 [Salvia miltiorrhiza]
MNFLVWNVRGFSDDSKSLLKEHCRSFLPLLVGIIEPKKSLQKVRQSYWRSINLVPRHQNFRQPRRPNIWLLTSPDVQTTILLSSDQVIIVDCVWQTYSFRVAVVHGANYHVTRRALWTDLLSFVDGNTVFIGDFNAVKGAHERRSLAAPLRSSCSEFCDFIEASDMIESPSSGIRFTWSGRILLPRHVESRLDRAFFSPGFANLWASINTHALPRLTSDHSPLIFQCSDEMGKGRRFKFLNMWTSHPNFLERVASSWDAATDIRCPIFKIMFKLRRLRNDLRAWNKDVFGQVDMQINSEQVSLLDVQNTISDHGYTDILFEEEVSHQARLYSFLARKNSLLQQKNRAHWLSDGDRNTSFFHRAIRFRKQSHRIEHLKIADVVSYDRGNIQQHIIDFFSSLFKDESPSNVNWDMLEGIIDQFVSEDQNGKLTHIPDDEEIMAAVFSLDANSSPGPDGYSGKFFQSCWSIIRLDILSAVRAFFLNSYLPAGCNASILILIPKKDVVETVADLRPIILSNFFFKIISKILASRLGEVAAVGVSPNQFGFIGGRSIHDCIMLGSEGFSCMNRTGKRSNMACKVDIRKAFDTMRWDFILNVLRVNGFHGKFIEWISIIFSSAQISILYNGQLSGYFACSRGVRQGDPLSPILFGIAEDVLSHLFLSCVTSRHITSMDFSRKASFPTHLFYADDILIFCKASMKNARKIKKILDFYGDISGQICNPTKSHVFFGRGVSSIMKNRVISELGFAMGSLPVTYLGVPIFAGRMRASYLIGIYDKIVNKFSSWKGLHLSMAGRICLVRSVIQSSVTHSMMIYRWPKSLIYKLDRKCRNFIWSGHVNKKPSCPVSWSRVCASRSEGGLGVRSFSAMNRSFLMKMAWKLVQGREFAPAIMATRYLSNFGYAKMFLASSPFWTGVREHVNSLVMDSYSYIGTGEHIYFWHDDWLGYKLADKLHIPPFMRDFLQQAVSDYFYDGVWHFTPDFIIQFPDLVVDILLLPIGEESDTRFWKPSVSGEVSASLAYVSQSPHFPKVLWGTWIWERFIPDRRSLITWRILHLKMPTLDGLIKRGMHGPNRCVMCGLAEESIDHLFWNCSVIRQTWVVFFDWFAKSQMLDCLDIHTMLAAAWNTDFSPLVRSYWKAGVINFIWKIWDCRNQVTFNEASFHPKLILGFLKVVFKEMDSNFPKLGRSHNSWQDYLVLRRIGVAMRAFAPPLMIEVHWWPPAGQWIKVNTDGSALGKPGSIAAGGVFRDNWGAVRGCYHYKGGSGFAFEAELFAIMHAVRIANFRGWHWLWIEADSSYVVQLLHSRSLNVPWRFLPLWKQTLNWLSNFRLQISHIFREGNSVADIMANHARIEGWWPFAIEDIKIAVSLDMATHSRVRLKN